MVALIKAAQLIASLSILVLIHEFGHFLFAKLFKTRVEKFYLFFDPWFSLFKVKKGETEYGIGWLPLGGYVKISGMIDESMDKEQMKQPAQPYEFRAKKTWQRLLIMIAGVLFNFILALFIYSMMLYVWGDKYLPPENAKFGIYCDSLALDAGFKNGDKILSLDGQTVKSFSEIFPKIVLDQPKKVTVERDGNTMDINLKETLIAEILKEKPTLFLPAFPFIVKEIPDDSPAKNTGLQVDDHIAGIDSIKLDYFYDFPEVLQDKKGQEVILNVKRKGQDINIKTTLSEKGLVGVIYKQTSDLLIFKTIEYGFFASIPAGISKGYNKVGEYLKQFKLIFSSKTKGYKSIAGPIGIANLFPAYWSWEFFWNLTALLSIALGVANLLPIPALDGGHVMFLIYEMVVGKKPSDKFMEYAQIAGMVILFGLLALAMTNDILNLFK